MHHPHSNKISLLDFRNWEEHPVTQLISEIFKEMYYEDAATLTARMKITGRSVDDIALQVAEFKGRQQVIEKFKDLTRLKEDILDKYIEKR